MVSEVLLHVVIRGGTAQLRDTTKDRAGPRLQRGDHVERHLVAPTVPDVLGTEVLRVRTGNHDRSIRPLLWDHRTQPVGALNSGYRLLVGIRLGVDRQPHAAPVVIAVAILLASLL